MNSLDTFVIILGLYNPGLLGLPSMWAMWLRTLASDVSEPLTVVALEPFTPLLILLLSSTYIHWGASARGSTIGRAALVSRWYSPSVVWQATEGTIVIVTLLYLRFMLM